MTKDEKIITVHIFYKGRVQGIGFRYTARSIAGSLGLTGWVKNLADGRVEAVVSGNRVDVEKFLDDIDCSLGHYIQDKQISLLHNNKEYLGFEIVY